MGQLAQDPEGFSRVLPALPVTAVKTYQVTNSVRPATCEEVACPAWLHGWKTIVPADSPQAAYIRTGSGRAFTEERQQGGLAEFTFEPGQMCFGAATHRLPWDGTERFWQWGGDWRGRTTDRIQHTPDGWLDSFGEHQQRLAEAQERG